MGILEKLRNRSTPAKAVLYARFSSNNQRDESIDAQERVIKEFARSNNVEIIREYVDRAKSATTDDRPNFQQMIADSAKKDFELVLVHKLDRFARNRNDSIMNRMRLQRNGVALLSVTEPLDDKSPEAIILQAVLEAMAEYYSKNLAREVRKGLKENALKCQHTGGRPPLGYDVDKETRQLIINPVEAEAVRIIYKMTINGHGYHDILTCLNDSGYKTKAGRAFGKNSLFEILRNPKYKGEYTFNRSAEANPYTKCRNMHPHHPRDDLIVIPGGVPQIVSDEDFNLVQQILAQRRRHSEQAKHHREVYLLSGKIYCGVCGCRFAGNRKNSKGKRFPNITYRCNNRARRTGKDCSNKEINRDYLETFVLSKIEEAIFNEKTASIILERFQKYLKEQQTAKNETLRRLSKEIETIEKKQNNLTNIIADGLSDKQMQSILLQEIKKLDVQKDALSLRLHQEEAALQVERPDRKILEKCFQKARQLFRSRQLKEQQELVNLYVEKIIVYPDQVEVILNLISLSLQQDYARIDAVITRTQLSETKGRLS